MIDDGSAEDAIGLTGGGDVIALNEFAVVPGNETITSVSIAWGTAAFPDPSLNGLSYTAVIWSDPNGDGNPSDAAVLATAPGTVTNAGTDTFVSSTFNTTVTTANFFVGFLITHGDGQFPAAFDETPPTLSNRSYIAGGASGTGDINNLNNNDLAVAPIESFGLIGNWLIRADAGNGSPTPTPTATPTPTPPAGALWYNGDFDGVNGLANQENVVGSGQYAHTYDDFFVTDEAGWDVNSVFSNDLSSTTITGATWEVRQGVSAGNGGTVVASGMTATPNVTPTGRSGFGFTEFMVEVPGLNLHLNGTGDNHYWLNVSPIGGASGQAYDSTTSGANCIGTPCGNNGMAFFDSDFFGFFFTPSDDPALANGHDFSMGVNGEVSGGGGGDLTLLSAFSEKDQGGSEFDIDLPLTGDIGIEPRDGGKDEIYLVFGNNITDAGSVTSSCGTAGVKIDPDDAHNLIVTVGSSHCNATTITITVSGVMDDQGNTGSASVSYGKLLGDVNGDGIVNNKDAAEVRHNSPRHVDSSNFRDDVNVDGMVNNKDLYFVKANRGSSL